MKIIVSISLIVLILILIKNNTNNLQFMTGDITETFLNPPPGFVCEKDDVACILSYQKYNPSCQKFFSTWKKFQDSFQGKKINHKNVKILAIDTTKNPNLGISKDVDGPDINLVSRYDLKNYDGRLNLKNLENFLKQNI